MVNPSEIKRLMHKKGSPDVVGNLYYTLMTNCNQPYSEVRKMPIPLVISIIKRMEREQKEMEKEHKKIKSKGRKR